MCDEDVSEQDGRLAKGERLHNLKSLLVSKPRVTGLSPWFVGGGGSAFGSELVKWDEFMNLTVRLTGTDNGLLSSSFVHL